MNSNHGSNVKTLDPWFVCSMMDVLCKVLTHVWSEHRAWILISSNTHPPCSTPLVMAALTSSWTVATPDVMCRMFQVLTLEQFKTLAAHVDTLHTGVRYFSERRACMPRLAVFSGTVRSIKSITAPNLKCVILHDTPKEHLKLGPTVHTVYLDAANIEWVSGCNVKRVRIRDDAIVDARMYRAFPEVRHIECSSGTILVRPVDTLHVYKTQHPVNISVDVGTLIVTCTRNHASMKYTKAARLILDCATHVLFPYFVDHKPHTTEIRIRVGGSLNSFHYNFLHYQSPRKFALIMTSGGSRQMLRLLRTYTKTFQQDVTDLELASEAKEPFLRFNFELAEELDQMFPNLKRLVVNNLSELACPAIFGDRLDTTTRVVLY